MPIAALYDVHGNLPALEAVLEEIRQLGVDQVVVGGDVLLGPMPRETLTCLLDLEIPVQFIYGNCEIAVLDEIAGKTPAVPEQYRSAVSWNAQQISQEHRQLITNWPKTLSVEIAELGKVLFCHATPRNENEIFTRLTPEDRLLSVFEGIDASVVVCGHTHMQFDRTVPPIRVLNAGSLGMPFGEPGADWLLLGPSIQFRHTNYDLAKAAQQVRNTSYPQADDFADRNILRPPSEAEMLELFTRVALR